MAALGPAVVLLYLGGLLRHGAADAKTTYFALTMAVGHGRRPLGLGVAAEDAHGTAHVLVARALAGGRPPGCASRARRSASTIGLALVVIGPIAFAQMALSYPTGRLAPPGRLAWLYVFVGGYLAQVVQNVVNLLYSDLRDCPVCPPPRVPTLFHLGPAPVSLAGGTTPGFVFVMAILPIGLFVLYRAYARASPGAPPVAGAASSSTATFITCTSWIYRLRRLLTDRFSAS